jgi:hypothetical protein
MWVAVVHKHEISSDVARKQVKKALFLFLFENANPVLKGVGVQTEHII